MTGQSDIRAMKVRPLGKAFAFDLRSPGALRVITPEVSPGVEALQVDQSELQKESVITVGEVEVPVQE